MSSKNLKNNKLEFITMFETLITGSRQVDNIPILDILISATSGSLSVTHNEAYLLNVLSAIKNTHCIPIKKVDLYQGCIDLKLFGWSIKKLRIVIDQIEIYKNNLILYTSMLNFNSLIQKVLNPIIYKLGIDMITYEQVTALDVKSLLSDKFRFFPEASCVY